MNPGRITALCLLTLVLCSACSVSGDLGSVAPRLGLEYSDPVFVKARGEVDRVPDSPLGYVNLAALYMKEARKTGDFFLNSKAEEYVTRALAISPHNVPARKLEASLHLANHRFTEAVEAATRLRDEIPADSFAYGVLADAYVETGDYANAVAAAQKMVDLKPGTASYSRVAQLRSLHGDHKGAIEMFTEAARAADPTDKETQSWCLVQLGDEYWKTGKYPEAEKVYDEALANYPGYFLAMVSKARVRASAGDYTTAEALANEVQAKGPNANAAHLLGDIHTARGETAKAELQYSLYDELQERLGDAADHKRIVISWADRGKIEQALEMARAEYAAERSIHSADLLAWSLFRSGRAEEAAPYIREAMRLGTNDARMLYHAGLIAMAIGQRSEARRFLEQALMVNPGFDVIQANTARKALSELR
jgi:tetratricopeptide (TPR) repeat protein